MASESSSVINETTPLVTASEASLRVSTSADPEAADSNITDEERHRKDAASENKLGIIAVLLVGVFVANSDTSLVLATYGKISSDFNSLESGRWLLTAAMLAQCATQPLYGKISNIYGRKPVLLTAYSIFGLGCIFAGSARSMTQIIFGRIIEGIGSAGMVSLVSILISDLVPLKDVATYRSYVNIISTTGRSVGGPLGGYIAQKFGWRWSFYSQCPIILLGIFLVAWKLHVPTRKGCIEESSMAKLKRIDFVGSAFLSTTIVSFLLALNYLGTTGSPFQLSIVISLTSGFALLTGFCLVERFWAREPIFPLELLAQKDVCLTYLILACQMAAQLAIMSSIPLYFQITQRAKSGQAGAYLVPAVLGNTIGGLATGIYIQRTGEYKLPIIVSGSVSAVAYTLLLTRWRGHTRVWESMYVFPGGLGTGIAASATFIALAASVAKQDVAIAGTGLYTASSIGAVVGISISGAALKVWAKMGLEKSLGNVENGTEIARRAFSDVSYVNHLHGHIHRLVIRGYLDGFRAAFTVSLLFAACSLSASLFIREHKLRS